MLEEGQVERSADGVVLALREEYVTAVVAALDSAQNVLRIVLALAVGLDHAGPLARRRNGEWLSRVVRSDWVVGSVGGSDLIITLLDRRSERR